MEEKYEKTYYQHTSQHLHGMQFAAHVYADGSGGVYGSRMMAVTCLVLI